MIVFSIFENDERDGKLGFSNFNQKTNFKIFPNLLKGWKIGVLCIFILVFMHLRRINFNFFPMKEVHKWILNQFRKANLIIYFKGIFYHFRRINFENSKDLMIMMVINWLYLTIFPFSNASLSDPLHWVMVKRPSLGRGPTQSFGFTLTKLLVGLKSLGCFTASLKYHR